MQKSETIGHWSKAISQIQSHILDVPKNKTVKVKTKSGHVYEFSYSDLEAMRSALRPLLGEYGVSMVMLPRVENAIISLDVLVSHESGEWVSSTMSCQLQEEGRMNVLQTIGSAITYMSRYCTGSIFGFGGADDDDANLADGNQVLEHRHRPPTYRNESQEIAPPQVVSKIQIRLEELGEEKTRELQEFLKSKNIKDIHHLTCDQAHKILKRLESAHVQLQ